jgi:hypothetical protein
LLVRGAGSGLAPRTRRVSAWALCVMPYFAGLSPGRVALWCYLIWYLVTVVAHFDPSPAIWLNSLGIDVVIGVALLLSVERESSNAVNHWQTFRLFLMPFCVSSFSALIKGQGYILILPPQPLVLSLSIGLCAGFVAFVLVLRTARRAQVP